MHEQIPLIILRHVTMYVILNLHQNDIRCYYINIKPFRIV